MASNKNLQSAKNDKNDEFYTQLNDIADEIKHYKNHFKWKVVFCNCDDPYESNFFKYFALKFNELGLKKLIATWYSTSPIIWKQLPLFEVEWLENETKPRAYKIEINKVYDVNWDDAVDLLDVMELLKQNKENKLTLLKGDWDFQSEESIELLKTADIICTNPPFSLFKEYVPLLMKYKKSFLIIWPISAITYKHFFPMIKNGEMWLWYNNWGKEYEVSEWYASLYPKKVTMRNWKYWTKMWNTVRYTNLDIKKRHEELVLYKKYVPEEYPKYETFDAIDVATVSDIPYDYDWIMWVPKSFMNSFNPEQFEILWFERDDEITCVWIQTMPVKFLERYRAQWWKWHYTSWMKMLCYYDKDWNAKIPFSRVLIRKK